MANSAKRMTWAKTEENRMKVDYYLFEKALEVMAEGSPNPNQRAFAEKIYTGQHDLSVCSKIVMVNATIGDAIDKGNAVLEDWIEYSVKTEQWQNMADAAASVVQV